MLIINASNIKGGGALQVTLSLINDLFQRDDILFVVSSYVYKNLKSNRIKPTNLIVHDFNFIKSNLFFYRLLKSGRYTTFFSIFGPLYLINFYRKVIFISGFAQPWVVYPNYKLLNFKDCFKYFIKYKIQSYFFGLNNVLICESVYVENFIKNKYHHVSTYSVPNALSSIVSSTTYSKIYKPFNGNLQFGLPSGYYLHKNLVELFHIQHYLKINYNIDTTIHLTLSNAHISDLVSRLPTSYDPNFFNHGLVSSSDIVSFYKSLDIVILPSFLECFSVTPIEALHFGIKTFVRDLPFNKAVYLDHVDYYNDVENLCQTIYNFINNDYVHYNSVPGYQFSSLFTSEKRTNSYLKIIKELYVQE